MRTDEQFRHECEVQWCVRNFYPDGERMKAQLALVKRRRGAEAANRLRTDVLAAWQAERNGAARIRAEMRAAKEAAKKLACKCPQCIAEGRA